MSQASPIRVAIVNDYEVVVHGVAAMLRSYADSIEVVELNARTSVAAEVDVALFDTFAASRTDDRAIVDLLHDDSVGTVIVYTWEHDDRLAARLHRLGVPALVSKRVTATELVDVICRVHAGERPLAAAAAGAFVGGDWPGREEGLTGREAEVLALITQGLSNADIVERTGLSINSIKSYIRSAYRKIGVTSRSRAVLWGVAHGFTPDRVRLIDPDVPGAD